MRNTSRRAVFAIVLVIFFVICATSCTLMKKTVKKLATVVTEADIASLEEYERLEELDLTGSTCYAAIRDYIVAHHQVDVTYTVDLGGTTVNCHDTELTLAEGSYDYGTLLENLEYLPEVKVLSLPGTKLTAAELGDLEEKYPYVAIGYDVELFGKMIASDETALDLSDMKTSQLGEAIAALSKLPHIASIELMRGGGSELSLEEAREIKAAAPNAKLHYEFELFGQQVSADTTRLEYDGAEIGTEGLERVRAALDVMDGCEYIKLADCGIGSEDMAKLRDDYPEVKVVWRVRFGEYMSCLTDEETIRAIFRLDDTNCSELQYCTDVKYMDIGHNTGLYDISFVANMTKLEIVIVSGSPFMDMTPFENCPELQFLELVWCGNVADLKPIKNCSKLEYLNICYTKVDDLEPIKDLPLKRFCYYEPKLTWEQQQEFRDTHPDCWTNFDGENPYVLGWRYDDQGYTWCDMYKKVREVFRYDDNFYNNT